MKILLAPSEKKQEGGEGGFNINSLFLPELKNIREKLLKNYLEIILNSDIKAIGKMFGLKKETDIKKYIKDITKEPVLKAVLRYTGVAFEYLDYPTLPKDAQNYLDENLLIFSNLFGVIKASDKIPQYRLKQGETIGSVKVEKIYKEALKEPLNEYLKDEDILDIRAGFYDKFYKPNKSYTTLKFLKNGKVVSHWAKAYRGKVLRKLALSKAKNIDEFLSLDIEGLILQEIRKIGKKQEIIYLIEN